MIYTREELIEKVKKNDYEFFKEIYEDYYDDDSDIPENDHKEVWYLNWGDGNDIFVALEFPNENLTVLLEGTYSSHDSTYWEKVTIGVPFEFKETRYRSATIADFRDMKIEELLEKK